VGNPTVVLVSGSFNMLFAASMMVSGRIEVDMLINPFDVLFDEKDVLLLMFIRLLSEVLLDEKDVPIRYCCMFDCYGGVCRISSNPSCHPRQPRCHGTFP
jgi:hypothetical protein